MILMLLFKNEWSILISIPDGQIFFKNLIVWYMSIKVDYVFILDDLCNL